MLRESDLKDLNKQSLILNFISLKLIWTKYTEIIQIRNFSILIQKKIYNILYRMYVEHPTLLSSATIAYQVKLNVST